MTKKLEKQLPKQPPLTHEEAEVLLETVMEQIESQLKRILFRFQIPPEDREDILQEVAVIYLSEKWKTIRNLDAWLVVTLKNRCLIYWRRRRSRLYDAVDTSTLELLAGGTSPTELQSTMQRDLEVLIRELPERCQTLLRLRYVLGHKLGEVARIMRYQPSSVRTISSRCLKRLEELLEQEGWSTLKRKPAKHPKGTG